MINLLSLPLNVFAKSATCPSAEALLAFSESLLSPVRLQLIAGHLEECDFCRAELQLLEKFPCRAETTVVAEMPASLRAFAESIFQRNAASRLFESSHARNH